MLKIPIENFEEERLSPQLVYIIKIFEIINNSQEINVEIDFTNTRYCSCFLLGNLYCILEQFKKQGKLIHYKFDNRIGSYLQTIKFDTYYLMDSKDRLQELCYYEDKRYLPILHYPRQARWGEDIPSEVCGNALFKLISRQTQAKGELKNDIDFILSEITANILEHSESEHGTIYSQFSHGRYLDIFIADSGIGVLNCIRPMKYMFSDVVIACSFAGIDL